MSKLNLLISISLLFVCSILMPVLTTEKPSRVTVVKGENDESILEMFDRSSYFDPDTDWDYLEELYKCGLCS